MTRLRQLSALAALAASLPLLAAAQGTSPAPGGASAAPAVTATTPTASAKPQRLSREQFRHVDSNGDGTISRDEAAAAPQVAGRFDELDTDHDGRISAAELKSYAKTHRGKGGFDKLDANGDGVVTRDEVSGNPRLLRKFEAADTDHDGRLSPAEARAAKGR